MHKKIIKRKCSLEVYKMVRVVRHFWDIFFGSIGLKINSKVLLFASKENLHCPLSQATRTENILIGSFIPDIPSMIDNLKAKFK